MDTLGAPVQQTRTRQTTGISNMMVAGGTAVATATCDAVPALVARIAAAAPRSIALRAGAAALTYGELVASADRLARELVRLGVGRDVPVGICLPRSFEQIAAALGVMRAGAAFLPLDPAWPRERLRRVLDDAAAPVVVADVAVASELTNGRRQRVGVELVRGAEDDGVALPSPGAGDLAYVIYTSGSTGAPKGVEITHGNLLNLVFWHRQAFEVSRDDRASHVAGLGFDAAVWEIWPYLTAGASVSLAEEAIRGSAEQLRQWLVDARITVGFVPTPLAEPMIASPWPAGTELRLLLTGGDTLHAWPVAGLPFAVINNYGPTECTVVATSGPVPSDGAEASTPSIGWPIANTEIHLLDDGLRPVAAGELGEICIGGAGVGRGYRNRPDLTAEKFVELGGQRLYRTGDLGRRLPDGRIAFRGRNDSQLKLRGHRVEPDEISAALNRHPAVAQSAVVARDDGRNKQLVAYVVPSVSANPGARELRDYLALTLPEYMLPSVFVRLTALPLTANGKVDRAALPAPSKGNILAGAAYRAPDTPVEQRLAAVVAELLGVARVGADDNFFLLGGHSLLGTQLVMRAREIFAVELALRDLFEAQTVSKLAATIERRIVDSVESMSDEDAEKSLAD